MKKMILAAALFAATLCLNSQAQAAYSQAPSWMPMSMLSVGYNAGALTVVDQATYFGASGINPLLVTNTTQSGMTPTGMMPRPAGNANFDPTKPWYVAQGTAFSRQFGWDDPTAAHGNGITVTGTLLPTIQSVYGANSGIWIEQISASAGLKTYYADGMWGVGGTGNGASGTSQFYSDASGNPIIYQNNYNGIFGTNGSSTKWQWDGTMTHNLYTVSLSGIVTANQLFSANYKVYVGDAQGNEIFNTDGTSTATFETWTLQGPASVPMPIPAAAWLLGSGLMGLVGLRRKNRV